MINTIRRFERMSRLLTILACLAPLAASAHGGGATSRISAEAVETSGFGVTVTVSLPPAPAGVSDLKFRELYRMPLGPRGLELSERARALNGKRVRMVGYMVEQEITPRGGFILSPLPVMIGDEDESLADDLPPSVVFVHLDEAFASPLSFMPGLLHFTGTFSVGPREEADGRVSSLRLTLDRSSSEMLLKLNQTALAATQR